MAQPIVYESGDTIQFTWTASLAPDAAPVFSVKDRENSVVQSGTSLQSGPFHYYSMFTMPGSMGWYLYEWRAVKTIAGTVYPFVYRGVFRVEQTTLATIP